MKHLFAKCLSALLIAALLLSPVAMMEEAPAGEPVAAETESQTGDVPENVPENAPEDAPEDVPTEAEDVPEEAVIPEALDADVSEEAELALDEAVEDAEPGEASDEAEDGQGDAATFEAQVVEESLDDIAQLEAAEDAPAPKGEAVTEETAEASAKAMAEAVVEIPIDAAHFPDAGFRVFIAKEFDHDGNGALTDNERNNTIMDIKARSNNIIIQSLVGIEYFNVQTLSFETNSITALDISNIVLPDLIVLSIWPDQNLTSVKIGSQPKLEEFHLLGYDEQQRTSVVAGDLDLTGCPSMRLAWLGYFNNLKKVYINPNSELNNLKFDTYFTEGNSIPLKKAPKHYWNKKHNAESTRYGLTCPHNTKLITNTYIPASGVEQIAVAGKHAKAAVNVGTTFQIDPGAKAGKKFKSSKKKVATVSANGIVTAKAKGKTKITFKVGKKQRTLTLTVTDPTIPTSVALQPVNTAVKKGESVTLTPVVPEGTNPGGYRWKSSNRKVATVNNGVVTFKKKGKVTITCTAVRGKKKAKIRFKVSKQKAPIHPRPGGDFYCKGKVYALETRAAL